MSLSVKFYLESKSKGNPTKLLPIFLYLRHQGQTLKIYVERKCHWNGWNSIKGRANPRRFGSAIELNSFLSDLETEAATLYNFNLRKGIITTKADILGLISDLSGQGVKRMNFLEFAEDFISKNKMAPNTKKSYQTTINILKEFVNKKRRVLDFNDIDLNFHDDFTSYMWDEKGFNDNTVGKNIKNVKSLMNQAFERDLHSNMSFKKKGFEVFRKDVDSIYLSEAELDRILNADLSGSPTLIKARDVFYVACWLGLRFSDLVRVTKDKFMTEDGMTIFRIEAEKTSEIVKIPLSPKLIPILRKYDYTLPVISNQKLNDYLKDLGKKAGIEDVIEVTDVRAGKKHRKLHPKYELITSHTARRSFATNLYLQGVPPQSIMSVTGHKTEKSFLSYLKLTNMQKIREIDSHFKKEHKIKMNIA